MDQPTADPPSNMPAMLDVKQPEGNSTSVPVPVAPHPPEEAKSKSTGKRRGHDRKDANKHKAVEVKNTTMAENAGKLVVGDDGISRVNGSTIYVPFRCSHCTKTQTRCTGLAGKPCDQCRSLHKKCSNAGRSAVVDSDASQESDAGAKLKKSKGGLKRKAPEGGSQNRKRLRKDTEATEFNADAFAKAMAESTEAERDRAYGLVDNYLRSKWALEQWHKEETARRAKRGKKGKL